jgi:hypothetical protein
MQQEAEGLTPAGHQAVGRHFGRPRSGGIVELAIAVNMLPA